MSPKLITFLTTIVLFIFVGSTYGQVNNTNKGAAVIYTTGLPTGAVRLKYDSEVAINTTNGKFYRYDRTNSVWIEAGSSIGYLNSGAAPSGDPKYGGPELIINNDKELYWYYGGVWNCVNCAALGYTAGTGINITGTTITNTLPDQTVTLGSGVGILVSGSYPNFTITNDDPDQTVTLTGAGISSVTGTYPNFTITSTEVDGSITNEIQRIDSLYLSNDTLFISLLNDALPASAIKLTGIGSGSVTGGGIYGQSDTVSYQHLAVIDSGLTFSSTEDTAYFNIVTAPGAFGSAGYFNTDSIRLRHYDIGGSNELILNDDGVLLKTTTPDRVTIEGNDARYAADYRATYSDRSLIDKKYGDDFYLQEIDTFRVSNDTLYISLIRDSVPQSFVVLPAGSGSSVNLYELDIITPLPAVDVEGSMVLKTVDVNGSKILYVSNGTDWVEGGLFLDTLNVATINIGNDQVTYAKIQEVTAERLLGNPTGSTANPSEISLGSGLGFSGSTILNTGDLSTTNEIQQLDTFEIVSNVLRASLGLDGVPFKSVDLSPYLDNTDSSGYNSAFTRSGDTLFITDGLSTKFVVLPSGIVDTDDQTLSLSNDTLYISQGNSVFLGQYLDNTDSQQLSIDSSIVEGVERFEISLDSSTSIYFDVPQVTDTDNQRIDTFSITNAIISLSLQDDALPASTIDITESVQDITGTMVESNTETGIAVTYDDGTGKLNFVAVDQSITNEIQTLDTFEIVSDALIASMLNDGVPFKSVDLSPYLDNTDTSGYNISFTRSNDTLYLNDGDGQLFVKLPADQIGVDTSGSNYTFTRSNDTLFIADQNGILSVKLPTDNIGLDTSGYNLDFSRSNDTLFIRDGNGILSVKLPASVSTDTSGYNLDFRISDDSLYIRDGQDELFVNLDPYLDNTDTSGSNYTFTRSNDTLFIADQDGILSVKLPADNIGLDTSGYNLEFIRSNDTLYLRDGDGILSVKLPESVSTDTSGYNLQVRISGDTLYIRDGDGELFVDLADYLDNTDAQTLLIDSTDIGGTIERFGITISNGNKVYIDVPQVSGSGAGQNNVGVNIGSGIGIYAGKTDTILQFKSLVEGYGIDLSNTSTEITIRADTAQLATSHDVAVVQGDIDAHELADGDLDDTNELQSLTIDSVAITGKERFLLEISDGNTVAFDVDLNTDTQDISIDSAATTGGQNFTVTLQDGGDVDFFIPTNTDNQTLILDSAIVGSVERFELEVSNGNSVFFDIPQITDTDNQSIDTFTYSSGIITLSLQDDGLPAKTIDISGVNTDNQTIDTFEIVSNVLRASLLNDGLPFSSVSLSAYLDNTDNQTLDTFEIVSNILRASNFGDGVPFKSVDLSPYLDNTDTQDLSIDSTTIGSIERFTINLVGSPSISFDVSNTTGTVTSVAATQPAAGITISGSPITGSGTLTFALANDLAGLEGQSGTGIVVRTGDGTYAQRTATVFSSVASTANLAIGNANGVSGNPLISIETDHATNKLFVQAVSTTNLDLNGTETIDGISVTNGQRVLVAGQTAQEDNGIWNVVSAGAWTRSTDANTSGKIDPGILVNVKLGVTYGGTMWRLTTVGPYTLGSTDLVFEEVFKDEDPTNELQTIDTLSLSGTVMSLSLEGDGLPASTLDFASIIGSAADVITLADSAALKAYTGTATAIMLKQYGREGMFIRQTTSRAHDGFMVFTDGNSNKWVRVTEGDVLNVKWFGATGNGTTDDYWAIQRAIDYSVYEDTTIKKVFLPSGNYSISRTIHMGYGASYSSISLVGDGTPTFRGEQQFNGATITTTFSNGPAINIQGARKSEIRNVSFIGLNDIVGYWFDTSSVNLSNWIDPTLDTIGDNRYTPYAAITIDAYSGAAPTPAYPNISFPDYSGISTQYNKFHSSQVTIDNVHIYKFIAGIVVKPNSDNNGDFVYIRNSIIERSAYGISVGNSQARNIEITGSYIDAHTAITNSTHGAQTGRITKIENDHFGGYQWFDLQATAYLEGLEINNCYGESFYWVGTIGIGAIGAFPTITFNGCKFQSGAVINKILTPTANLAGSTAFNFNHCSFTGNRIYLFENDQAALINFNQCIFASTPGLGEPGDTVQTHHTKYYRGFDFVMATNPNGIRVSQGRFHETSNTAGGGLYPATKGDNTTLSTDINYGNFWSKTDLDGSDITFADLGFISVTNTLTGFTGGVSLSDRTFTGVSSSNFQQGIGPGDLLIFQYDNNTLPVVVSNVSGLTITGEIMTGYAYATGGAFAYMLQDTNISTVYVRHFSSRKLLNKKTVFGDFTSGSQIVTGVTYTFDGSAAADELEVYTPLLNADGYLNVVSSPVAVSAYIDSIISSTSFRISSVATKTGRYEIKNCFLGTNTPNEFTIPVQQIVYGNGTGPKTEAEFNYDSTNNRINLNTTSGTRQLNLGHKAGMTTSNGGILMSTDGTLDADPQQRIEFTAIGTGPYTQRGYIGFDGFSNGGASPKGQALVFGLTTDGQSVLGTTVLYENQLAVNNSNTFTIGNNSGRLEISGSTGIYSRDKTWLMGGSAYTTANSNVRLKLAGDNSDTSTTKYGLQIYNGFNQSYFSARNDGNVILGGRTVASEFQILEASGSGTNYTGFKAQPMSADIMYTLPAAAGTAGQQLTWNASNILTWEDAGSSAGGNGIYGGSDFLPDGGTEVYTDSGYLDIVMPTVSGTLYGMKISANTASTVSRFLTMRTEVDSMRFQEFGGEYQMTVTKSYQQSVSDQFKTVADSVQWIEGTIQSDTQFAFISGLTATGWMKRIEGTADNQVLLWNETDGGYWEIGTAGGGGVSDGDKGDVDVTGSGLVWTVDTSAITNLKLDVAVGGFYKGSGTMAAGVEGEIPLNSDFAINYNGGTNALYANDATGTASIKSKNGNQYVSVSDDAVQIHYDAAPSTDHTASGKTITLTANENQAFGDVCYIASDGDAALADADAIATSRVRIICVSSAVTAGNPGTYLLEGVVRDDSCAWTVGGDVYLSTTGTTGNTLTQTQPSGTDDCVVFVGIATHADRILFNPSPVIIELN